MPPNSITTYISTSGYTGLTIWEAHLQQELEIVDFDHVIRSSMSIQVKGTLNKVIAEITKCVGSTLLKTKSFIDGFVLFYENIFVSIDGNCAVFEDDEKEIKIVLHGKPEIVEFVHHNLSKLSQKKDMFISWSFVSDRGITSKLVRLPAKHVPHDSFYPWIKEGIGNFLQSFMDSDSSVLLLLGEPGSGKTTLIRHLIHSHELYTLVTYDEVLMGMDQLFVDFVSGSYDVLVLEDADVLLRDRSNGNKIMNKLLNTSDGLVPLDKKIIITANITRLDEIDPALIRPGRCFETLMFRELTHSEATLVAQSVGVPEPEGPCTLSKLFSKGPETKVKSNVGFSL